MKKFRIVPLCANTLTEKSLTVIFDYIRFVDCLNEGLNQERMLYYQYLPWFVLYLHLNTDQHRAWSYHVNIPDTVFVSLYSGI